MRVTRVEKITNEKWINLFRAAFEHNGHNGEWVYASRRRDPEGKPRVDAVVMVPVLYEDCKPPRLVLLKEFRVPLNGYNLAFPAGLLEEGENVEEAVKREMFEETGFEVTRIRRISPPLQSSAGLTDETSVLVFIDVKGGPDCRQHLEASEELEVMLCDFAEVSRLCDDPGSGVDAKAWATLHMFQQLGRLDG